MSKKFLGKIIIHASAFVPKMKRKNINKVEEKIVKLSYLPL